MNKQYYNQQLLNFIYQSPTPFHAVKNMREILEIGGFTRLPEETDWDIQPGGRYYTVRNGSSLIAFIAGHQSALESGIRLVGAHTDSPCLKVKPKPELNRQGYFQLGVEVYGGALLNPWFDRDLSIAGRLVFDNGEGSLDQVLIDLKRPVAVIPSLAIHLDRDANNERKVNPQTDIPPLLFRDPDKSVTDFFEFLAKELSSSGELPEKARILDHELYLYDCQKPVLTGMHNEFISGARLDNLLSCFTGVQALLEAGDQATCMLICNDHEEVGSISACGANGPMLQSVLQRLYPNPGLLTRVMRQSLLVSADNAHGIHPNFADRHDSNHGPRLNEGPVIKMNANQRYATNSISAAMFRHLCEKEGVAVQTFVNRTDLSCGSTIGPITAAMIGVQTLDVGVPTFAMHSIREMAGADDAFNLYRVLRGFYNHQSTLVIQET
ncbi:M18 family aminopeptidase [Porticoccus sp.]|uniref:M18 family aminopeptidase n=1 Tax=Porticoccus sp. TaxID=2024853 RepID=UPI000C394C4C|nr:M18 family aminopeptidase [Porticoccus sp.]MAZ70508.1 M18 family aminopeptidase [Porticoccus sp.]|tara:strand:+ start:87828 stop:89141 length:1314 start_codon:yes stop_codon:yes gene_type:complete